jgi:hypothetical protein
MEKVRIYLYKRYLDNLTERNIIRVINSLNIDSQEKLVKIFDDDNKDTEIVKHELYKFLKQGINERIRIPREEYEKNIKQIYVPPYEVYDGVMGELYDLMKYYINNKNHLQEVSELKQLSYEDYIKNFPKVDKELVVRRMNTFTDYSRKLSQIFSKFTTNPKIDMYENMTRDIYILLI